MRRRSRPRHPYSVKYVPVATDGSLDQTLTIQNNTDVSVRPTLTFVTRDLWNRELTNVVTRTVNGTDRGGPLLPAHGSLTEILSFDGPGSRDVRFVEVGMTEVEELAHPELEGEIKTVMIDLDQKATDDPAEFWGIGMVNPNSFGVTVRVSLVQVEDRVRDYPRQVVEVVTLQEDVDLASMSNHVIWLPEDVRGQFHEVVHHLRPPTLI